MPEAGPLVEGGSWSDRTRKTEIKEQTSSSNSLAPTDLLASTLLGPEAGGGVKK